MYHCLGTDFQGLQLEQGTWLANTTLIRILLVTSVKAPWGIFCKKKQGQGSRRPQTEPGTQKWKTLFVVCPCLFLQRVLFALLASWQDVATLKFSRLLGWLLGCCPPLSVYQSRLLGWGIWWFCLDQACVPAFITCGWVRGHGLRVGSDPIECYRRAVSESEEVGADGRIIAYRAHYGTLSSFTAAGWGLHDSTLPCHDPACDSSSSERQSPSLPLSSELTDFWAEGCLPITFTLWC